MKIVVKGRQTHAALPWLGVDPVALAAQMVLALELIPNRQVDPTLPNIVSIAMIHGGHARNIIPDDVELQGTARAFSTKIAYVSTTSDRRNFRLIKADADGERAQTILESNEPILSPSWSPDGKQLAYVSFEDRRPGIYRQVIATGQRERLTNFPGLNGAPSWSPDGRRIAMVLSKDKVQSPKSKVKELESGLRFVVNMLTDVNDGHNDCQLEKSRSWLRADISCVFSSR